MNVANIPIRVATRDLAIRRDTHFVEYDPERLRSKHASFADRPVAAARIAPELGDDATELLVVGLAVRESE